MTDNEILLYCRSLLKLPPESSYVPSRLVRMVRAREMAKSDGDRDAAHDINAELHYEVALMLLPEPGPRPRYDVSADAYLAGKAARTNPPA